MSKRTPGPWECIIHESVTGSDYIQILSGSWDIAHNRHTARDWEEEKANARLIAAAPDLLEACKGLLTAYSAALSSSGLSVGGHHIDAARKAIAKAESEEPKK